MIPVILIGSMKCGTSTLYNHLIKHPEICGGVSKEPEFFSEKMGNPRLKEGKYSDLFDTDPHVHRFTLDASTGYSKHPAEQGVPERIKEYGLDPYFLYIVRDPLDRIRSHYNFMKKDPTWKAKIDAPYLVDVSNYFMQLQHYAKLFPKNRIHVIDFDEFSKDPIKVCSEVFDFIGAHEFSIKLKDDVVKNLTRPTNHTRNKIRKGIDRYTGYMPSFMKKAGGHLLNIFVPLKQKQLSKRQRARIMKTLAEDMKSLKATYHIDTTKWGF